MLTSVDVSSYRWCIFIGKFRRLRSAQVCKYASKSRWCPSSCLLAVIAMFLDNISLWNEQNVPRQFRLFFNYQNNLTLSPGFLGQRFNNLQQGCTFEVILTSSVHYDKILSKFGQQQLLMVNYACGFKQSETGKYFEWMIKRFNHCCFKCPRWRGYSVDSRDEKWRPIPCGNGHRTY